MEKSNSMPNITWNSLRQGTLIGNGSFGDVYQGTWNGKQVAIKLLQMKTLAPHLASDFTQEAKLMWNCRSDNTLTLHGICTESGHYAMVTELMSHGSLFHVLNNQTLDEQQSWQIALDMAQGLAHLHNLDIIHRDFKSFNVLIDDNYHAKISDFGLAKLKIATASGSTNTKKTGSVRWRAPELFKRGAVSNKACDIYSFGMVLWELCSKKLPFEDATDEITVMGWIKDGEKEVIPDDCPEAWKTIIQACWSEPAQRPTALEIVKQLEAAMPKVTHTTEASKSWHLDAQPSQDNFPLKEKFLLLNGTQVDYDKVQTCYAHHPVPGYVIQKVEGIYNPNMNRVFWGKMDLLQERHNNPGFTPKWQEQNNPDWRKVVYDSWQQLAAPHQDSTYPNVKLLPLWHGTDPKILGSIFRTGYANLATTDGGFFGKGLYSAHEAEYSYRVYGKGALILNWVASYSTYPVIHGDMAKLSTKGNYANYDSHFVPVVPENPKNPFEVNYHPTKPNQKATYHEMVVFDNGQCLPRYLVTLQADGPGAHITPVIKATKPTISNTTTTTTTTTASNKEIEAKLAAALAAQKKAEEELAKLKEKANKDAEEVKAKLKEQALANEQAKKLEISIAAQKKAEQELAELKEKAKQAAVTVNQHDLSNFLCLVAQGEQDEAEAMLKKDRNLALAATNVTDLSGRTFNNITGFQYAVWALDSHMWEMIRKYLPVEAACEQINNLETATGKHGKFASWQNLIDALAVFIDMCNKKQWDAAAKQWNGAVGNAQQQLPVHVVNQYCHPTRSFSPCPNFQEESALPRSRKTDVGDWFTCEYNGGKLGVRCWSRGRGGRVRGNHPAAWGPRYDRTACVTYLNHKTQLRDQLLSDLASNSYCNKPGLY